MAIPTESKGVVKQILGYTARWGLGRAECKLVHAWEGIWMCTKSVDNVHIL